MKSVNSCRNIVLLLSFTITIMYMVIMSVIEMKLVKDILFYITFTPFPIIFILSLFYILIIAIKLYKLNVYGEKI